MADPGYVYVLINPSMPGLTKIGRTERDPEDRVRELSSSTGVPTPFILVYHAYFASCSRAEAHVHTLLESKGHRLSSNREFFNGPVKDAIDAVIQAAAQNGAQNLSPALGSTSVIPKVSAERGTDFGDDFLNSLAFHEEEIGDDDLNDGTGPWDAILEEADSCYWGFGDRLQDHREALRLYKQAATIGSGEAYERLASMYLEGEGCRKDAEQAITYFKEAINHGKPSCYASLAGVYLEAGNRFNVVKCWDSYFNGGHHLKDFSKGYNGHLYLSHMKQLSNPVQHLEKLAAIKNDVIEFYRKSVADREKYGMSDFGLGNYYEELRLEAEALIP
jgi:hypothetical protein